MQTSERKKTFLDKKLVIIKNLKKHLKNIWKVKGQHNGQPANSNLWPWPSNTCPATLRVTWPTTVSSSLTPVSDNCVLPTLKHSLSVGRAAVLETGPLPPQDHKSGTVCRPVSDYCGLSYGQFRRLLETLLFGQWGHGTVWTVLTLWSPH